jgi:hypothetical protein
MVGTITPVVYGPSRLSTWYRLLAIYTASQLAGALLTGLALAAVGMLLRALCPWSMTGLAVALATLSFVAALHDLKLLPFRLPSHCWQVPQSWRRFSPSLMAACYGFSIGLGVLTRITFGSFFPVLLACVGLSNLPLALSIMVLYGAARAGTVAFVARGQAFVDDPSKQLRTVVRLAPLIAYLDGLLLAFFTGLLLGQFV